MLHIVLLLQEYTRYKGALYFVVIYIEKNIFVQGQAYYALSRVKLLEGLKLEKLNSTKMTGKKPCNNAVLAKLERMWALSLLRSSTCIVLSHIIIHVNCSSKIIYFATMFV